MSHVHRPPVPTRLAGWRPAAELADAIEAAGLVEATLDRTTDWGPAAEVLSDVMATARTPARELAPTEWQLAAWAVAERERGKRWAEVSLSLAGRAFGAEGAPETVRVHVWARRAPSPRRSPRARPTPASPPA